MFSEDTIVAISTAMSNSGIGIIRISGDKSIGIISKIFKPNNSEKKINEVYSHTVTYGYVFSGEDVIDEALVLVMKAPNTYTKEDVVEIDCHGGVLVLKKILDLVIEKGARPANPGEFTKRAFLNGRIDLSQAEAVMDIINSENSYALNSSVKQLRGVVSDKIKNIRALILNQIAFIEASLDDPENYSLENYDLELLSILKKTKEEISILLESSDDGKIIKEGIKTVILGKPNVGKSSLLNNLLGEDRAIVTSIAGTTRDSLEENLRINEISLNIIDTAGIRSTEDFVEKIGVEKSKKLAEEADLIVFVIDSSLPLDEDDYEIAKIIKNKKVITLLNKSDLNTLVDITKITEIVGDRIISVSAKENTGINEFIKDIKEMFYAGIVNSNNQIFITNSRHKAALKNSLESIVMVEESINSNMPEDFFSIDLMNAYKFLGEIIGESIEDDLVNEIFSKFCMGK